MIKRLSLFIALFCATLPIRAQEPEEEGWRARAVLEARDEATLSSEVAARIREMPLREGERFKKGARLVVFDCALYEAELAAARAELLAASKKLENDRQLLALNSVGALEVELSRAEAEKARAEVSRARVPVDRCVIAAPYDGRVVEALVHEHESVAPGDKLIAVLDDTVLELKLIVPSSWLNWLRLGSRFTAEVDETGARVVATVSGIGSKVDAVSQSVRVSARIEAGGEGLLAGMSATALFDAPER